MMRLIVCGILLAGVAVCFVGAWVAHSRNTRELDRLGKIYRCQRWPSEDNASYHMRLKARIGRAI